MRLAKTDIRTTVIKPQTAIESPLIAPSTSPICSALVVPRAWLQVPMATPFATGSVTRNSLRTCSQKVFPVIPATQIEPTVIPTIPPYWSERAIPIAVVIDFGRRETYSTCEILKQRQQTKIIDKFARVPTKIPPIIAGQLSLSFWNCS